MRLWRKVGERWRRRGASNRQREAGLTSYTQQACVCVCGAGGGAGGRPSLYGLVRCLSMD